MLGYYLFFIKSFTRREKSGKMYIWEYLHISNGNYTNGGKSENDGKFGGCGRSNLLIWKEKRSRNSQLISF